MKKILSFGVAAAMLATTAIAASATDEAVEKTGVALVAPEAVVAGETAVYNVVLTATADAAEFTVVAGEGLTLESIDSEVGAISNVETGKVAFASAVAVEADTVIATLTFTVTADVDADVTVSLTSDADYMDVTAATATNTVVDSADNGEDVNTADTADTAETGVTGTSSDESTASTDEENAGTGVALAVVPAVLAAAAVVVAKKRK